MKNICCFIGHRKIERTKEIENRVYQVVEDLIVNNQVETFLFGSKSEFNELCYEIVSKLKERFAHIKRIYFRAEYQYIGDEYKNEYFLDGYENSFLPDCCKVGSKASYIERNKYMIDMSDYCVFYYNENYEPEQKVIFQKFITKHLTSKKSGTKISFEYAFFKKKKIFNIFN